MMGAFLLTFLREWTCRIHPLRHNKICHNKICYKNNAGGIDIRIDCTVSKHYLFPILQFQIGLLVINCVHNTVGYNKSPAFNGKRYYLHYTLHPAPVLSSIIYNTLLCLYSTHRAAFCSSVILDLVTRIVSLNLIRLHIGVMTPGCFKVTVSKKLFQSDCFEVA